MSQFTIYPRGYTTGAPDAEHQQVSAGDLIADSLYDYMMNSHGRAKNWKFHSQILDLALVCFGDFNEWLDTQLSNPLIIGSRRDFLLETIGFILGAPRTVHHASWAYVLEPIERLTVPTFSRLHQSHKYFEKNQTTTQILQQWCQQPDGIYDLLSTLYILFGHPDRTPG
jgi:hypothetical protein